MNAQPVHSSMEKRPRTPSTATLHYATEFNVSAKSGGINESLLQACASLKQWGRGKDSTARVWLEGHEFIKGGVFRSSIVGTLFRTERAEEANGDVMAWAMYYQQRDHEVPHRFWHVDVAFKKGNQGELICRVSNSYSLNYGYFGWDPSPPEPSAPNFVSFWLANENLTLRAGLLPIAKLAPVSSKSKTPRDRLAAIGVRPKDAEKLHQLIFQPDRTLPVVLINGEVNPITFPIDPNNLQRRLLGTCYVLWVPPAPGWSDIWDKLFPSGFACPLNAVRIYQPGASADRYNDARRHRFFREKDIRENGGPDAFAQMLQHGLVRQLMQPQMGRIASCDDVVAIRAESDFKTQLGHLKSKDEVLALYEEESGIMHLTNVR